MGTAKANATTAAAGSASNVLGSRSAPTKTASSEATPAKTTTETGLRVRAELDKNTYATGIKVTDDELACVNLRRAKFHGEWNYTIRQSA